MAQFQLQELYLRTLNTVINELQSDIQEHEQNILLGPVPGAEWCFQMLQPGINCSKDLIANYQQDLKDYKTYSDSTLRHFIESVKKREINKPAFKFLY